MLGLTPSNSREDSWLRDGLHALEINPEIMRSIGVDPNSLSLGRGWSCAHSAVLNGDIRRAGIIVSVPQDMTVKNAWNFTPIELAEFLLSNVIIILE